MFEPILNIEYEEVKVSNSQKQIITYKGITFLKKYDNHQNTFDVIFKEMFSDSLKLTIAPKTETTVYVINLFNFVSAKECEEDINATYSLKDY